MVELFRVCLDNEISRIQESPFHVKRTALTDATGQMDNILWLNLAFQEADDGFSLLEHILIWPLILRNSIFVLPIQF